MKSLLFLLGFISLLTSCSKDISADALVGTWEVTKFKSKQDEKTISAGDGIFITFEGDSALHVKMSVNTCEINFEANNSGAISLLDARQCTYACCDQDWELEVGRILQEISKFHIVGQTLTLTGVGVIMLTKD